MKRLQLFLVGLTLLLALTVSAQKQWVAGGGGGSTSTNSGLTSNQVAAVVQNLLADPTGTATMLATNGTNFATTYASTVATNGTNFAVTIGANGTNFAATIGANGTNFAAAIGANDTNFASTIGANGTNFTSQMAANATNFTSNAATNMTNYVNSKGSGGVTVGLLTTNIVANTMDTNVLIIAGFGTAVVNGTYTNKGMVYLNGLYWRYIYTNMLNNGFFLFSATNSLQWYIGTNVTAQSFYSQPGSGPTYAPINVYSVNGSQVGATNPVGTVVYNVTAQGSTNYYTNTFTSGLVQIIGRTNVMVSVVSNANLLIIDATNPAVQLAGSGLGNPTTVNYDYGITGAVVNGTAKLGVSLAAGLTNFYNYTPSCVLVGVNSTSFDISGMMSEMKWHHAGDNFDFAAVGYDDVSNTSKAGQFGLLGAATLDNGNLCGFHVINTLSPDADKREFVLRVKAAKGSANGAGGYALFENKLVTGAPMKNNGFTQVYANWLLGDEFGRVSLGELGQPSDATGTALHSPFEVTVYGSYSGAYPPFGFGATSGNYSTGTATNGAMGFNGTNFVIANTNEWLKVVGMSTNATITVAVSGFTNSLNGPYRLCGLTGTSIVQTNPVNALSFSRGTITVPQDIVLQPGERIWGSSIAVQGVNAF